MRRVAIPSLVAAAFLSTCPLAVARQDVRSGRTFAVLEWANVGSQPVTVAPRCPRGTQAIGGGFQGGVNGLGLANPPRFALSQIVLVYESHRAGRRAWRSSAITLTNPDRPPQVQAAGSLPFVVFSNCRAQRGKLIERVRSGPIVSSEQEQSRATATCPRNTVAISGGFAATPVPGPGFTYPSLFESLRSGRRSWTVVGNPWRQTSLGVKSYVECTRSSKPPAVRSRSAQTGFPLIFTATPDCPKKTQAISGGFQLTPNSGAVILGSDAITAKNVKSQQVGVPYPIGRTWVVGGGNPLVPTSQQTGFAYCG